MNNEHHHEEDAAAAHGTLRSYTLGFGLSLLCTFAAFAAVSIYISSGKAYPTPDLLAIVLIVLALFQLCVQLVFFLHVGRGQNAAWNAVVFALAGIMVAFLVIGSIWIMNHLEYGHEQPDWIHDRVAPENQIG